MKRDFEKYFPLPLHIEEDETGQLRTLCPASGTAFMDFGIVEGPLDFDGYDVQEYLVQCANLMPEAVEVIRDLVKIVSQPDYDPDSLDYADYVVQRAKELLAKMEGGAEDATNP